MKKTLVLLMFLISGNQLIFSQKKIWDETKEEKKERMQWWTDARFGMFIHWGLYAQPARHEWVKSAEKMTNEDYQKYFDVFNPDLYNPHDWAKQAKKAGMKYAVITAKHHEGFNLFDSKFTDYKSTNTPYGKDILREWVEAFRSEGLKIGFYYSLFDWHHPHYTADPKHPLRAPSHGKEPGSVIQKNKETENYYKKINKGKDFKIYQDYLHNQVREILTEYGKIDVIWLDFSFPELQYGKGRDDWDSVKLLKMVRKLQPHILVNNRADLDDYWGGYDFETPEQKIPEFWPEVDGEKVYWETCATFSGSWGYYRDENTWKTNHELISMIIETTSKGGNLLLNVGPTARGSFDYRAENALEKIGKWMKVNGRSIYECTQAPNLWEAPKGTMITFNPKKNRLYIHITDYKTGWLKLDNAVGKIKYAQFLHDNSEIKFRKHWDSKYPNDIVFDTPNIKPNVEIPVIELFLN